MYSICKIKNISGTQDTLVNAVGDPIKVFTTNEIYTIEDVNRLVYMTLDDLISKIGSEDYEVHNASGAISGISNQIDHLKMIDVTEARDTDDREIIHTTPRYLGTYVYFTGSDDDHTDPHAVGGDDNISDLMWEHEVNGDNPELVYMDFNTIYNETYVRQGDLQWKDALQDYLKFNIVPSVTEYTSGSNTNYNLYGGYLIIPADGDGTIAIADNDRVLVQCTPNEFGVMPAGYWDADWNTSTKVFDNITAAPLGDGEYNMFGLEVVLHRFMNRRRLMGTGRKDCMTEDVTRLGHRLRIRVDAHTHGNDHAWSGNATLMMYRKKTC